MADEYNEDYYNMLQQQNYDALLNKEVQLDNARRRALKYTNASLGALGLASSGYGQTATSGVENQYLQALDSANANYVQQTEQNAKDAVDYTNSLFNNFMQELLSYDDLSTQDKINGVLGNYGLLDDNGELSQELFNKKYGSGNWGAFKSTLDNLGTQSSAGSGTIDMNAQVNEATEKAIKDEMNFIQNGMGGLYEFLRDGDYIKVSENKDDKKQVYYVIQNGQWVKTTKQEYENSKKKYWVRSYKNSKDMIVDYNGKTIYDKMQTDAAKNAKTGTIATAILTALTGGLATPALVAYANANTAGKSNNKNINNNYDEYIKALSGE